MTFRCVLSTLQRRLSPLFSSSQWFCSLPNIGNSPVSTDTEPQLPSKGTIYEDTEHQIKSTDITSAAWSIIWRLKRHDCQQKSILCEGFEAFFVGGTVRDLCCHIKARDVDIITSAELTEVNGIFGQSVIIGKRFPICLITLSPAVKIEVSSFSTTIDKSTLPPDLDKSVHLNKMANTGELPLTWSVVRRLNAISRDFSVNALMYEPCTQLLFDYANGFEDLKQKKLRCLKEPVTCFTDDPARILRAIRFEARLGFTMDTSTEDALKQCIPHLKDIPQSRLQYELQQILTHGPTATAFRLMWKYGVLDWILPDHAQYLKNRKYPRNGDGSDYLFDILETYDTCKRGIRDVDEATNIVMISAALVANIANTLYRFHKEYPNTEADDKEAAKIGIKNTEDASYGRLVELVLSRIAKMKNGDMIFPRGSMRQASKIFKRLKAKHIHEVHNSTSTFGVRVEEQLAFFVLEKAELKWKERSNLGLKMLDPDEPNLR